jgi:hypothetical protein
MSTLTIGQLEHAINRARVEAPSQGIEAALSYDVGVLAGLYGRMIHLRLDGIDWTALEPRERTVLERWLPSV